jgi:iron-sulfur cluster assembly protein
MTGTELDYETNLLKRGFKFNNPQARGSCSCGESFAV